jgi:hypothetical protein
MAPTRILRKPMLSCAAALLALAVGGCGREDPDTSAGVQQVEALPQPAAVDGAVTGMPDAPGPGEVPLGGEPPPPPPLFAADEGFGMPLLEDNPETGLGQAADAAAAQAAEPGTADAAALLRQYFAALAARDPARAYGLWSDGGRASGFSPEQFAAEHASTVALDAQVGEPGVVESAAGTRMVEVPVLVRATQQDGSVRVLAGRMQLRRAVVAGADSAQQAWRIASADLREAAQ